jgi:hypothetical protein
MGQTLSSNSPRSPRRRMKCIPVWINVFRMKQPDNGSKLFTEVGVHLKTTLKPRRVTLETESFRRVSNPGMLWRRVGKAVIVRGKSPSFYLILLDPTVEEARMST